MIHKSLTRKYDERVALLVGRIPARVHQAFHALGYLTMPGAWMALFGLLAAWAYASGGSAEQHVLVLVLLPLGSMLKLFFRRRRPPTIYADAMRIRSYSFPSGHAYSAMLGGGYVTSQLVAAYPLAACAAGTLIVAVGVSRIHIGAHYPSDVTAGWLLGALALWIVLVV